MLGASTSQALASLRGKVVVLNFWASWCEPCQTEAPLLEHAQGQLARHGATVLGVTYQDTAPDSEGFVRRYHLTYPELRDVTSEFAQLLWHEPGARELHHQPPRAGRGDLARRDRTELRQPGARARPELMSACRHSPTGVGPRRPAGPARGLITALLVAVALATSTAPAAAGVAPRASLPAIERQVMCVTCKVALDESQSPQADSEREYIQSLIDRGEDEAQIKRALVAQYGPTVLGLPSAHGFDLAAYLVPALVVLGLVATVLG